MPLCFCEQSLVFDMDDSYTYHVYAEFFKLAGNDLKPYEKYTFCNSYLLILI